MFVTESWGSVCKHTRPDTRQCMALLHVRVSLRVQVADKLPNAPAVLVTAGDEGAAYCCRSTKGEHSGA